MKEKILTFLEKYLTGFYSIKLTKDLYLNFPKLAPVFTLAILVYFIGETYTIKSITYVGYLLVALSVFGFFFHNIFPNRKPKTPF
jgi:hypothetical protein